MKNTISRQRKAFMKEAFEHNCITTSYGGEILVAQNKEGLRGTFYAIYPNGKPRQEALIFWERINEK